MYLKGTILASTIVFCFGVVMFMEFLYPTIRESSIVVKEVYIEQESPDFSKEVEEIKTTSLNKSKLKHLLIYIHGLSHEYHVPFDLVKSVLKRITKNKFNDSSRIRYELVRNLIKIMVNDLIRNTKENLKKYKIKFSDDIECQKVKIVSLSDGMIKEEKKLKLFLKNKMYLHPRIRTMTIKAKKIISDLFDLFIEEPSLIPDTWNTFENKEQKYTNVCDYISGMTDNYAINIHRKFFDLYSF